VRQGGANINFCDSGLLFVSTLQLSMLPTAWRDEWAARGCMPTQHRSEIIALLGLVTTEVTADDQFKAVLSGTQLASGELVVDSSQRSYSEIPYVAIAQAEAERAAASGGGSGAQDPRAAVQPAQPLPEVTRIMATTIPTGGVPYPGFDEANLSLGDIIKTVGGIITNPIGTITSTVGGLLGGNTGSQPGTGLVPLSCPDGYKLDNNGRCVATGIGGAIDRFLPGGSTGVLGSGGQAVMGAFGAPAMVPAQVGTINGQPILKCRAGMVLGKDNLCYVKSSLPRQFRKWAPAPKPPITGGDAKAIRRAESAKKRVKKLASAVGFTTSRKGAARSWSPPKKKC
jgi:hypothetical protein